MDTKAKIALGVIGGIIAGMLLLGSALAVGAIVHGGSRGFVSGPQFDERSYGRGPGMMGGDLDGRGPGMMGWDSDERGFGMMGPRFDGRFDDRFSPRGCGPGGRGDVRGWDDSGACPNCPGVPESGI
jgi:hypothetical protein